LRRSRILPLGGDDALNDLYYYEAQISFLLIGVDECLYTSYCIVDTYYGSESGYREYLKPPTYVEPATGGLRILRYPHWNPREYFLCVLSIRLEQIVKESQALLDLFEERMNAYVCHYEEEVLLVIDHNPQRDESLVIFTDDRNLSRTEKLTQTVSTIQRVQHCYTQTIRSWEAFESDDILLFEFKEMDALRPRWNAYFSNIKGNIADLRILAMRLDQYLALFTGMKDGVCTTRTACETVLAITILASAQKGSNSIRLVF
jgi:hypothetical protein